MDILRKIKETDKVTLAGVPEGFDAIQLGDIAGKKQVLHIARDDVRLAWFAEAIKFFNPKIQVLEFPSWDTVPYDRVSPNADIVGKRLHTLVELTRNRDLDSKCIVITTASAILQRVPKKSLIAGSSLVLRKGEFIDSKHLLTFLEKSGYGRVEQVMEAGEYAMRGGIVDIYPPSSEEPLRLDLFGDEVESIRTFDPMSQRTTGKIDGFVFKPVSEIILNDKTVSSFRTAYRKYFGSVSGDDPLYEAVSEQRRYTGMENWLPCFYDGLDTLFEYMPDAVVTMDSYIDDAIEARFEQILEYFNARKTILESGQTGIENSLLYKPLSPELLYINKKEMDGLLKDRTVISFYPFEAPDTDKAEKKYINAECRSGRDFADIRAVSNEKIIDEVKAYISEQKLSGKKVIVTAFTDGSRDRLISLLKAPKDSVSNTWKKAKSQKDVAFITLGLERGFETKEYTVISEQDIFGDRMTRSVKKKRKSENFISDVSALNEGDIVVHIEHGIGRYEALETLNVGGAAHDCLKVVYHGGDKLFVPVENIEVLSRYGSEQAVVQLDKLGSTAWQSRKAKLKKRIRDMAEKLIKVAAQRHVKKAEVLTTTPGIYDEFCARFPYMETEDQLSSVSDVIKDLSAGKPMDRLVCGDVGFGKTEVALRASFVAAMNGVQVAVVAPTTLLVRQHYKTFKERFAGLPVKVEQLSRLVTSKNATLVKKSIKDGSVDIVIGTHALLAKSISFANLGMLIIDEEQKFGVAHKERLKELKNNVHVLTLTATPIPRTLQLALTGVRELSLIATPPVDRLSIRTFVLPFDPVVVREAILRERYRGGQTFFVCPRVSDIDRVVDRLKKLVPEMKIAVAHGQMAARQLEDVMNEFAEGVYDILVSTNIIESGLDLPSVNTMIIYRSHMFGLAQLYQLRGRIGRSKKRAYAYLTVPERVKITKTATRRLDVMQTLDSLGAGFSLASHDMDIRGAGNLLGEEQSGHIKEVGIELYQHLLEEAVAVAKSGENLSGEDDNQKEWSPQINTGAPVLIPESYISDLGVRLSFYRRISELTDSMEAESFAAEMIDRFGTLPEEVKNLLETVVIKGLCKKANVEKADAGPKGAVLIFRDNNFPNPAGLVEFISQQAGTVKLKPDHRLVCMRSWDSSDKRITGLKKIMNRLASLAEA